MHLGLLYSFFHFFKRQQLTYPLLMFSRAVVKEGEEEDSVMAGRTSGTSGPPWATRGGGRRTHRLQHVGPFLLRWAKQAFYLRVGRRLRHFTWPLSWWLRVVPRGPQRCTHTPACVFQLRPCLKNLTNFWSTKWNLFTKLFAQMICKSRDEFNDAN